MAASLSGTPKQSQKQIMKQFSPHLQSPVTPRRKLAQGSLVVGSNSQSAVFNPSTRSDSFPSPNLFASADSPSKQSLSRSQYGFSPEKQKPLSELDLTDSDEPDITERAAAELAGEHNTSIVVVDALTQRLADDVTEVTVTERVEVSPYKVICHSPRSAKISLRNSGDTHQAANVAVDLMHSVALGSLPSHNVVQREVDTSPSTDKMAHEASNSTNEDDGELGLEEPSTLQDISQELSRLKVTSTRYVASAVEGKKTKKKAGRVVPSRLMESTAAHRAKAVGQSQQDSYQSMLQKSRTNKSRYLNESTNTTSSRSRASNLKNVKSTPPPRQSGKSSRQASTPENIAPNESFDVSALPSNKTINRLLNETESFIAPPDPQPQSSRNNNNAVRSRQGPTTPTKKTTKSKTQKKTLSGTPDNITQDTLDVQYARYLQWLYMSSKAQKSIEMEEKEVMEQLHSLWQENNCMRQKLSALDQEYDRLKHVTDLDEMLDLQKSLLGPVIQELPQLSQYYQSMATALDTTRHELQTQGVHIPDTKPEQEEFEDQLMSALDESEQLLSEISSHTRRTVSTTSQYAQAINNLASSTSEQQSQINRCAEMVRAAQTLSNQENSLRIQEIEFSRL